MFLQGHDKAQRRAVADYHASIPFLTIAHRTTNLSSRFSTGPGPHLETRIVKLLDMCKLGGRLKR